MSERMTPIIDLTSTGFLVTFADLVDNDGLDKGYQYLMFFNFGSARGRNPIRFEKPLKSECVFTWKVPKSSLYKRAFKELTFYIDPENIEPGSPLGSVMKSINSRFKNSLKQVEQLKLENSTLKQEVVNLRSGAARTIASVKQMTKTKQEEEKNSSNSWLNNQSKFHKFN